MSIYSQVKNKRILTTQKNEYKILEKPKIIDNTYHALVIRKDDVICDMYWNISTKIDWNNPIKILDGRKIDKVDNINTIVEEYYII